MALPLVKYVELPDCKIKDIGPASLVVMYRNEAKVLPRPFIHEDDLKNISVNDIKTFRVRGWFAIEENLDGNPL